VFSDGTARFFGVLLGVGNMPAIAEFVASGCCEVLSESDCAPLTEKRAGVFLGVLCESARTMGDAGDEGGEDRCVAAKRARLAVGGGVVLRW
jgi:hypothetical protein